MRGMIQKKNLIRGDKGAAKHLCSAYMDNPKLSQEVKMSVTINKAKETSLHFV